MHYIFLNIFSWITVSFLHLWLSGHLLLRFIYLFFFGPASHSYFITSSLIAPWDLIQFCIPIHRDAKKKMLVIIFVCLLLSLLSIFLCLLLSSQDAKKMPIIIFVCLLLSLLTFFVYLLGSQVPNRECQFLVWCINHDFIFLIFWCFDILRSCWFWSFFFISIYPSLLINWTRTDS